MFRSSMLMLTCLIDLDRNMRSFEEVEGRDLALEMMLSFLSDEFLIAHNLINFMSYWTGSKT